MTGFPQGNRTYQILHAAAKGGYAVGAYNWYSCYQTEMSSQC